ncbi:MAG: hypothetical protein H6Q84_1004 [Deltaproteobacteria bacterium]|nr:hypothetical protein [Deltaproteobacteria bacterium]
MRPLPHFMQSPLLRAVPGVYHAFLGVDPVEGRHHGARLSEVFSIPPAAIGTMKQIHSSVVLAYDRGEGEIPDGAKREGDALWTASPGTGVAVRTADCVPILLAHRESPRVAAVHAGWRGLAAGIVREAVRAVAEPFGKEGVSGIVAAAGPCARDCCYEVGEETADALHVLPGATAALRKGVVPGKWFADLRAIALAALVEAGISPSHAEGVGPCTVCSPRFHSFRREKSLTGRQLSFIYIYR